MPFCAHPFLFMFVLLLLCFGIAGCLRAQPTFLPAAKYATAFFLAKLATWCQQSKQKAGERDGPWHAKEPPILHAPSAPQCTLSVYVCSRVCVIHTCTYMDDFVFIRFLFHFRRCIHFGDTFATPKGDCYFLSASTGEVCLSAASPSRWYLA